MNVVLKPNEHSCGVSYMTADMEEFQECLNKIEVDDICRPGLHFTWTKNLHKVKAGNMTGVLKKLDRVMTNDEFLKQYPQANAKFLPYIISDHTPSILSMPSASKKVVKAFRFSNFLTDKQEFIPIVESNWSQGIHGFYMYQVVKKLKCLKRALNNLGWSKGNLFKRVEHLRDQLKDIQKAIDSDPPNHNLRSMEAALVEEFCDAQDDKEKFMCQ